MEQYIGLIGVAVVLFASTNIDDVFVLLGFFSDHKFRPRQVVLGQFVGIVTLFAASVVASLLSLVVSPEYIGLLGLAPIAIGLKKLVAFRKEAGASDNDEEDRAGPNAGHGNTVAVVLVTLANGGDNLSIYTPLFALRSAFDIAIIGAVFVVMTAAWLFVAHWLTSHRTIGAPIRRYGHQVVPFVLIALGVFILYEAGTMTLLN